MTWPLETRIRAVQLRWQLGSAARARRALAAERGQRAAPPAYAIARWAEAFQARGSVLPRPAHRQPRRLTSATLRSLSNALRRSPKLSIRQLALRLGIPRSTVQRAIKHKLGLFPYKIQVVQRLQRGDKAKRLRFCRWLLSNWKRSSFRRGLLMTDEAHFYLDGNVLKQNCRIWGTERPKEVVFRQGQSPHVTVWCGVASWGIVGPYFFEERNRVATVTGARYRRMVQKFLIPHLHRSHVPLRSVWFQQDGARPHTAAATLTLLKDIFPGKVLSKGGSMEWPPRSPDLTLPDFFLWGLIKAQVYRSRVPSLAVLKRRIRAALCAVPSATLKAAVDVLALRARACIQQRGGYPETVLTC
jgi:AraC-like DNA-binding protein